jgi:hypothetical protein
MIIDDDPGMWEFIVNNANSVILASVRSDDDFKGFWPQTSDRAAGASQLLGAVARRANHR